MIIIGTQSPNRLAFLTQTTGRIDKKFHSFFFCSQRKRANYKSIRRHKRNASRCVWYRVRLRPSPTTTTSCPFPSWLENLALTQNDNSMPHNNLKNNKKTIRTESENATRAHTTGNEQLTKRPEKKSWINKIRHFSKYLDDNNQKRNMSKVGNVHFDLGYLSFDYKGLAPAYTTHFDTDLFPFVVVLLQSVFRCHFVARVDVCRRIPQ